MRISKAPKSVAVTVGHAATLMCEAVGKTAKTIRWFKSERSQSVRVSLTKETPISNGIRSTLTFSAAQLTDGGRYYCTAGTTKFFRLVQSTKAIVGGKQVLCIYTYVCYGVDLKSSRIAYQI